MTTTNSRLQQRLGGVNARAAARLDRLDAHFPEQKAAIPFDEYLARASVRAQADPEFKTQFDQAMRQYRMASEALNGSRK